MRLNAADAPQKRQQRRLFRQSLRASETAGAGNEANGEVTTTHLQGVVKTTSAAELGNRPLVAAAGVAEARKRFRDYRPDRAAVIGKSL